MKAVGSQTTAVLILTFLVPLGCEVRRAFYLSYRGEWREVGRARARIHKVFYPCNRCHLAILLENQPITVTTR